MRPGLLKWIYLFVLAIIWGSSFILMKRGLVYFRADQVAAIRMTVAFVAIFPFVARHYASIPKDRFKYLAVVGLIGSGIPAILFSTAQTHINSTLAGMLNSLTPVFTLLIGFFFFRTRFTIWQSAGVALGFIGAAGLVLLNTEGAISADYKYALLIVIATAMYGISVNTIKAHLGAINSFVITGFALLFAAVPYGIYLFCTDFLHRIQEVPGAWTGFGYIATLALFGTALSSVFYFHLVKIANPLFASVVTYFIPIVAMMWGLGDGEGLNFWHIPAMLSILSGVAMISYGSYRTRKNSEKEAAKG